MTGRREEERGERRNEVLSLTKNEENNKYEQLYKIYRQLHLIVTLMWCYKHLLPLSFCYAAVMQAKCNIRIDACYGTCSC